MIRYRPAQARSRSPSVPRPLLIDCQLRREFAHAISSLQYQYRWLSFVPSWLGQNVQVDAAAQACLKALTFHSTNDKQVAEIGTDQYGKAINLLASTLDFSDESLLATALLVLFETIMKTERSAYHTHLQGVGKILLARPEWMPPSDLASAIYFAIGKHSFRRPDGVDPPSPYENTVWEQAHPAWAATGVPPTPDLVRMTQLSNTLLIRLPRLNTYARALRGRNWKDDGPDCPELQQTSKLLFRLLEVEDPAAETKVLKRVKVLKTTDPVDRAIALVSLEYQCMGECETAVLYWATRMILIRTYRVLCSDATLNEHCSDFIAELQQKVATRVPTLKDEELRMASNIIMSWQYANSNDEFGTTISEAFIAVWGAISAEQTFRRDVSVSTARSWILSKMNEGVGARRSSFRYEDMDQLSDILVGGPVSGPKR